MRFLVLLILFLSASSAFVAAQSAKDLLPKVAEALSSGKDDYAVSLFRQSANAGMDQAELFYWTQVDKHSKAAPRLAQEMATRYKDLRNYDKAYLFYKEMLQHRPDDVPTLVSCAEVEMMRGKENESLKIYEKVLALDPDNLQTNIFLGNYYYLQAENGKKNLEENYKRIATPTKMQHARYRDELSNLFSNGYTKAKGHLQRVLQFFPSIEADKTLDRIKKMELEVK